MGSTTSTRGFSVSRAWLTLRDTSPFASLTALRRLRYSPPDTLAPFTGWPVAESVTRRTTS
ncbi:hypothetical protein D7V88_06240 [Corallococcus terminator]|uniref:Uncharacterized protein n=1 Tax=Corallococcus terminator TaxID=2316733 RepID=A0A3A8JA97_9BACT|nr:hypothetical protein D7V88_06240 [Corallococcus terminator]